MMDLPLSGNEAYLAKLRLDIADRLTGAAYGEADIGVRCGLGSWPGVESTLLMDEEVIAVCSRKLLPNEPVTPAWIARQTLIHDDTSHPGGNFPTWSDWLAKAGVNTAPSGRDLHVNSTAAVIQGAVAGRGVALIRKLLVAQEIDLGRLHHLMPELRWPVRWSYVCRRARAGAAPIRGQGVSRLDVAAGARLSTGKVCCRTDR